MICQESLVAAAVVSHLARHLFTRRFVYCGVWCLFIVLKCCDISLIEWWLLVSSCPLFLVYCCSCALFSIEWHTCCCETDSAQDSNRKAFKHQTQGNLYSQGLSLPPLPVLLSPYSLFLSPLSSIPISSSFSPPPLSPLSLLHSYLFLIHSILSLPLSLLHSYLSSSLLLISVINFSQICWYGP